MRKNIVFAISAVAFFAVTAVLLAILPWAGYTLLILSCLFTILYELKYANHQIKFFNNLRKQGALFEIPGYEVDAENNFKKTHIVGFHDKILVYNSTFKLYYNFKDVTQFIMQQKTSTAYGGFILKFEKEKPLKVLCLAPERVRDLFQKYYETTLQLHKELSPELSNGITEFEGNPSTLPTYENEEPVNGETPLQSQLLNSETSPNVDTEDAVSPKGEPINATKSNNLL